MSQRLIFLDLSRRCNTFILRCTFLRGMPDNSLDTRLFLSQGLVVSITRFIASGFAIGKPGRFL